MYLVVNDNLIIIVTEWVRGLLKDDCELDRIEGGK